MAPKLEFENGVLVKVDGMRPDYMDGHTLIRLVKELATRWRGRDEDGYELRTYRVVYVFRMGWIGDSEGRTWAKELYAEARFPTMEKAELHRQHHPDAFLDPWGQWRTKYPYGQIGIFTEQELIP